MPFELNRQFSRRPQCEKEDTQSCDKGQECWGKMASEKESFKSGSEDCNALMCDNGPIGGAELLAIPFTAGWNRIVPFPILWRAEIQITEPGLQV